MSIKAFDDLMEKAGMNHLKVHVVDVDGIEYEGRASSYTKADDEEDGYATFCIDRSDDDGICLGSNEIKSIEIL